jgi:AAA+ superfamily predicted ATPase
VVLCVSVILHGDPGTRKTLLAKALAGVRVCAVVCKCAVVLVCSSVRSMGECLSMCHKCVCVLQRVLHVLCSRASACVACVCAGVLSV